MAPSAIPKRRSQESINSRLKVSHPAVLRCTWQTALVLILLIKSISKIMRIKAPVTNLITTTTSKLIRFSTVKPMMAPPQTRDTQLLVRVETHPALIWKITKMSYRDLCTTRSNPLARATWSKERKRWRTLTKMPNLKVREWLLSEVSIIRPFCNIAKTTLSRTSPNFRLSMDRETWVLAVPTVCQDRRQQPSLDTTSQMLLELIPSIWPINKIVNTNILSMEK